MDRETVEEVKRYFDVVSEGVRGEVQAVAEGVGSLTERVESLTERVESLTGRVASLETSVAGFRQEVRHQFTETQAMVRLEHLEARA